MSNYTKSTNFATKDNLTPGDPLKVVRGTEIDTEFNNISTAIATKTDNSAAAITGGSITGITDLAIADGGTGASTATAAINNLLPAQTSAANKYLQSDGTNVSWDAVTLSTADITGTLPVANGGTGVTASTGTGNVVLSNSPTLVTPALGTPASGVATNLTGLPISTGVSGLGTGVATFLGTPSSANLASAVSDETGTGSLVFATSPTLVTPALGTPSALVGTNITGTASGLTAGNVTTNANLTGAVTSVGNATSLGSFTSSQLAGALTDETGSGANVFATSPTLVTPVLGVATATSLQGIIGNVTPAAGAFTTVDASGSVTLSGGTANGVTYLNGSKVVTSGSALTFDGSLFSVLGSGTLEVARFGTSTDNTPSVNIYSNGSARLKLRGSTAEAAILSQGAINLLFGVNDTETLRLTSTSLYTASGINVGIGTSSPTSYGALGVGKAITIGSISVSAGFSDAVYNTLRITHGSGNVGLNFDDTNLIFQSGGITPTTRMTLTSAGNLQLSTASTGILASDGYTMLNQTTSVITIGATNRSLNFATSASSNAMVLDASGNLLVGTSSTSVTNGGFTFEPNYNGSGISAAFFGHSSGGGNGNQYCIFTYNGATIGSIVQSGTTAVLYNVTSDYRLKTVIGAVTGHGARIDALKPVDYLWTDGGQQARGFLAHEFQTVYPNSVSGDKDATDANGNPAYQAMQASTSEVIADLIAEIQSLRQRVAQLETN